MLSVLSHLLLFNVAYNTLNMCSRNLFKVKKWFLINWSQQFDYFVPSQLKMNFSPQWNCSLWSMPVLTNIVPLTIIVPNDVVATKQLLYRKNRIQKKHIFLCCKTLDHNHCKPTWYRKHYRKCTWSSRW